MEEKGVYFLNKQIGISEFYPVVDLFHKTFENIADQLYEKLLRNTNTIREVMKKRPGVLQEEHRAGLVKFSYWEDGAETPIAKSEKVLDFYMNTGVKEVLFFVDVLGG